MAFVSWVTASMLLSPNGSSYSLILMLMPLLALANSKRVHFVTAMALLLLICFIPVSALGGNPCYCNSRVCMGCCCCLGY